MMQRDAAPGRRGGGGSAAPVRRDTQPFYLIPINYVRQRADRSGGDRYLGMVEAAGSNPARSMFAVLDVLLATVGYR